MKYSNAADVLPVELVEEIAKYVDGGMLYIPSSGPRKPWGKVSGSRGFYAERNHEIRELAEKGIPVRKLSDDFGLSCEAIRKIIKK